MKRITLILLTLVMGLTLANAQNEEGKLNQVKTTKVSSLSTNSKLKPQQLQTVGNNIANVEAKDDKLSTKAALTEEQNVAKMQNAKASVKTQQLKPAVKKTTLRKAKKTKKSTTTSKSKSLLTSKKNGLVKTSKAAK